MMHAGGRVHSVQALHTELCASLQALAGEASMQAVLVERRHGPAAAADWRRYADRLVESFERADAHCRYFAVWVGA